MNKVDLIIVQILFKICEILSKYSEKIVSYEFNTIKNLVKELEGGSNE